MRLVDPVAAVAAIPGVDLRGARSIPDIQARLIEIGRERRARRIAEFGYAADCECSGCGDSGAYGGEEPRSCHCPAGVMREERAAAGESWERRVPAGYRHYRWSGCRSRSAVAAVQRWLIEGKAKGGRVLLLAGGPGTGKTGLAISTLHELHFEHGRAVAVVFAPSLVRAQQPTANRDAQLAADEEWRHAVRVDVLLLDDLGAEQRTEFGERLVLELIEGRRSRRRPTIVTTNTEAAQIPAVFGDRIARRLLSAESDVVEVG